MSYYATVSDVLNDRGENEIEPYGRAERTVRIASRIVRGHALEPDEPWPQDFKDAARDATIAVFDYLWETRGFRQSQRSVTAADIHWYGDPQVLKLIGPSLGPEYFVDPNNQDSGKAVAGRLKGKTTMRPSPVSRYDPGDPPP